MGGGFNRSGNQAFDAWKETELARLEEERRKLDAAQKEFNDYLDHLRHAKDREEFDRFMNERTAAKARGGGRLEALWRQACRPELRRQGAACGPPFSIAAGGLANEFLRVFPGVCGRFRCI